MKDCSIESQIDSIRPGAKYIIHSGDYAGIEWLDESQTKPTPQEMDQALADCQAQIIAQVPPSLEARIASLEVAVQAVATKTDTPIDLIKDR